LPLEKYFPSIYAEGPVPTTHKRIIGLIFARISNTIRLKVNNSIYWKPRTHIFSRSRKLPVFFVMKGKVLKCHFVSLGWTRFNAFSRRITGSAKLESADGKQRRWVLRKETQISLQGGNKNGKG
jgi:hypothetical protein